MDRFIITSANDLLLVKHQPITKTNVGNELSHCYSG